jgi:phospholipid N-methyltransferase
MQQEQQLSILDVIFKLLHPQGCVSIVTYFIRCPISKKVLDQYNKSSELFGFTMKNIPPAYVYQIKSGHR